jgi:hypothetical protein
LGDWGAGPWQTSGLTAGGEEWGWGAGGGEGEGGAERGAG